LDSQEQINRQAHNDYCVAAESTGNVACYSVVGGHQATHAAPFCGTLPKPAFTIAQRRPAALGAKLGAIPYGPVWTAADAGGIESLSFRAVWTPVDARGHGLEIYGSEGWGLSQGDRVEFSRACHQNPCESGGFVVRCMGVPSDVWEPFAPAISWALAVT
jgi:hypothetical protein